MKGFPTRETVERIRQSYPIGTRVRLIHMNDPYSQKPNPGDEGTVDHVDDTGTIFVTWNCGSSLGVVYGEDRVAKI